MMMLRTVTVKLNNFCQLLINFVLVIFTDFAMLTEVYSTTVNVLHDMSYYLKN